MESRSDHNHRGWVYVIVREPEKDSSFFGLHDRDTEKDFIPVFERKEDANDCFLSLPREKGVKYEVQAIHLDELHEDAARGGFSLAFVDGDGRILKEN